MSGAPDQEYFSDGMTEELLNVLARIPNLKVAARTSVFQFKDKGGDVRQIGAKLDVSHIVEGSVRRDGEKVRVTAQLIRVSDGFHVWSQSYDRELKGVFALQDEIARNVAEQLLTSLGSAGHAEARGNVDPLAYDDYLKGRALYRARRNLLRAILHFESAVARAPEFATAWANLSLAHDVSAYGTTAAQQLALGNRLAQMRSAAERAAALAPKAATTLHALANVARGEGRFLDAERDYRESIARDATYPDVREDLSEFLAAMGRYEDALAAARELVALEPYNKLFWYRIAHVGVMLDRSDLIDEAVPRMVELDPTYFFSLTVNYRREYMHGRLDGARTALAEAYAQNPDVAAAEWGLFRWSQGESDIDDAFVEQLITGSYGWDYPQYAAMRGDANLYFRSLGAPRNTDKRFYVYNYLVAAFAAPYLADPRAKKLLREAGFEAYWRKSGWPDRCRPLGDADFECGFAPAVVGEALR
jgi:adenylate cyclase